MKKKTTAIVRPDQTRSYQAVSVTSMPGGETQVQFGKGQAESLMPVSGLHLAP